MFYFKRLGGKRPKAARVALRFDGGIMTHLDDKAQPLTTVRLMYNCSGTGGALKETAGIKPFSIEYISDGEKKTFEVGAEMPIKRAWHYKRTDYISGAPDDRLILLLDDMGLYEISFAAPAPPQRVGDLVFSEVPDAVNYKLGESDVIMFSSPEDSLTVYDGTETSVIDTAPKIRSMCTHYERLFAVGQDNLLWFSDDLDPTNWNVSLDQAGYIEFADAKGKLLKVVSFMDYLYIFRQYGITRLTAYADQTEFAVNEIYSTGGIYPDTVAVCGDVIYFLSREGLYSFDGLNVRKAFINLEGLFEEENVGASASCVNNEYLLSCKMKFDEKGFLENFPSEGNNAVFKLNAGDGRVEIIRAPEIGFLGAVMSDKISLPLICFNGGMSGRLGSIGGTTFLGRPLPKACMWPQTDLGAGLADKIIISLAVYTESGITVGVCFDGEWRYYAVEGRQVWQKIHVGQKGKLLGFALASASENMLVRPIEVTFVTY